MMFGDSIKRQQLKYNRKRKQKIKHRPNWEMLENQLSYNAKNLLWFENWNENKIWIKSLFECVYIYICAKIK